MLAEGSQKVNEKLKQVQHDKNFGRICKVQDAKYVREAHRKHLLPYSLQKKAAFTLAEVLITLGIIGIVAAMTIPTLVQNYKKKVVETKLVKVMSMMNQAIKLSTVENGEVTTWQSFGTNNTTTATYEDISGWFNKYIGPYLKTQKIERLPHAGKDYLRVYLMDGTVLVFAPYIYDITYIIDKKGMDLSSGENKAGTHRFLFNFLPKLPEGVSANNVEKLKYAVGSGFGPYAYNWDGTYEGAKHASEGYGCYDTGSAGQGALCTKLIELNGWKIPDDYPYKF